MERHRFPWSTGDWRGQLAHAVTDVDDLLELVGLTRDAVDLGLDAEEAARNFRLRVPRVFVQRMRRGDSSDPLLRQVLPTNGEMQPVPGFNVDPVGEAGGGSAGGVLHKYRGRALLVVTGACAVHCRYCFRRHYPYGNETVQGQGLDQAIAALEADRSISEVILSGGDPLSLADEPLNELCDAIEAVSHVRRLRWHTRTPVVLPSRVDNGLLGVIAGRKKSLTIVVHANHARELSEDVRIACNALAEAGVVLLNQSVLLAGVNDNVESIVALSERLFDCRVLPYYLHLLDKVASAAHFEVGEDEARNLMAEVGARLPGYLVPRLVREVEGARAKVVVGPDLVPAPCSREGERGGARLI